MQIKDEAWWLILGNTSTSELYAVKRISFSDHINTHMELPSSIANPQVHYNLQVYVHIHRWIYLFILFILQGMKLIVVSDCYLGYEVEHSIEKLIGFHWLELVPSEHFTGWRLTSNIIFCIIHYQINCYFLK